MVTPKSYPRVFIGLLTLFLSTYPAVATIDPLDKPYLTSDLQEKLESLPYGLEGQKSLFLRFKHVSTVQFSESAGSSRYGFKRGQSVLPEGLNMRLTRKGQSPRASALVQLKTPLDISKYNSLVLWVWASKPKMRLSIRLKGGAYTQVDALPTQGFPSNEPVQLVIPFSRFTPRNQIDFSNLQQISIEFGLGKGGNSLDGVIQVLGLAFVEQKDLLSRSIVVLGRATTQVVQAEQLASDEVISESIKSPDAVKKSPYQITSIKRRVRAFLKLSPQKLDEKKESVQSDQGASKEAQTEIAPAVIKDSKLAKELLASYSHEAPSFAPKKASKEGSDETGLINEKLPHKSLYLIFAAAVALLWGLLLRRRRLETVFKEKSTKILHEVVWPFSITQAVLHKKVEREFWRGVASHQNRFGWLSTTGLVMEKSSPSEYFGEPFLRRQIELADRAGMKLLPSLSFGNILSRRNMNNPNLEWSSVALRSLVTETLLRFSEVAVGVRVENVVEFLDSSLRRGAEHEFWADVISSVREKRPGFLFIADAVGDQGKLIREVGFDLYENDRIVTSLVDQIQEGRVGDFQAFLKGKSAEVLNKSIYNLSPLAKPSKSELERHQRLLAAIVLTFLPGLLQHDNNLPDELSLFISGMARSGVVSNGTFALLPNGNPSVLSFVRSWKKSLIVAVANFSQMPQEVLVKLDPIFEGIDNNKLYLFENTLHGTSLLKTLLNQPSANEPALALWGQNLRETGLPLQIPPLSITLFSVSLTKPLTQGKEESTTKGQTVSTSV